MPLQAKLAVAKTDLLLQEDARLEVTLTNAGAAPLQLVYPTPADTPLQIRVVDAKTGLERVVSKPSPGNDEPPSPRPLAPGKSLSTSVRLLSFVGTLEPGAYDVAALYPSGEGLAQSPPVRLKVAPTTPRSLSVIDVHTELGFAFWVNVAADPPELVRLSLALSAGGGARDLRRVAPATLQAVPAASVPPNGEILRNQWVAWIEGAAVKVVHYDEIQGPSPVRSIPVNDPDAFLVAPLQSDPREDEKTRPAGQLLLGTPRDGQLTAWRLAPDAATRVAATPLAAPRPAWITTVFRTDRKRSILAVRAAAGRAKLLELPWPGSGGAARDLGEFKGEFVAAAGTLGEDDVYRGVLLVRTGVEAHLDLERIAFQVGAKGEFSSDPAVRLASDPLDPFGEARLAVAESGAAAALLRTRKGFWHLDAGGSTAPLPEPFKSTPYPLELGFLSSRPVLIAGGREAGIRVLTANGRPLPAADF
jgi:hypothetical protein